MLVVIQLRQPQNIDSALVCSLRWHDRVRGLLCQFNPVRVVLKFMHFFTINRLQQLSHPPHLAKKRKHNVKITHTIDQITIQIQKLFSMSRQSLFSMHMRSFPFISFFTRIMRGLRKMQFCHAYVAVHYINKCGTMCANIACAVYKKNTVGETQKSFALGKKK